MGELDEEEDSAMKDQSIEALEKAGAQARAFGLTEISNPMYRADAMPAATGEHYTIWSAKAEAWLLGWKMENRIRNGRP